MSATIFTPGSLIRARGREWIVLSGSTEATLRLRPVSGSEEDTTVIHVPLESEPVVAASFALPRAEQRCGHEAALLLRDALLLSMRRGAGPFRSFGQIFRRAARVSARATADGAASGPGAPPHRG